MRGAGDRADDGDASAHRPPADAGNDAGEVRPRHEPSPRAEHADVLRKNTAEANAAQADASHRGAAQADTDHGDAHQADSVPVGADWAETDQGTEGSAADALERFDPRRAGLPEVSRTEAAAYIEEHLADRPWLAPARDCSPDVQRVIVALDQGGGHAHIRHEGWVTEELNEHRVKNLEDPAQLDPDKRRAGIDGLKNGNQPHRCGGIATRITDPEAFATTFVRGVEHPDVRAALDSSGPVPRPIELPISELMGEDGHKFCSGWRLDPVNGSMDQARANRNAWATGDRSGAEPPAQLVQTFEGGTVTFVFRPNAAGTYEISTMYVNPPNEQPT